MPLFKEVIFVSDENDPGSSVDCFDSQLGTKIGMYTTGYGVVRGTLQILNEEYFLSAEVSKPSQRNVSCIHVWSIDTRSQVRRVTIQGEITALGVSHDCNYCAAAINSKILVWNVASGQLLNVISYHHEPITKIMFWNSSFFITAGADGLVAVWRLVDIVTKETGDPFGPSSSAFQPPFFSSSKHSLPVTDIFVASGGRTCKLFTISADQNCHIFLIGPDFGRFVLSLTYDFVLTTVLCDHLQRTLFMGTTCGKVILFAMEPSTRMYTRHVSHENFMHGHVGAIKALSIAQDDTLLATGAEDKKIIVWEIRTKTQLHTCDMHGIVSNIIFHVVSTDFLSKGPTTKTIVTNFDKHITNDPESMEIKMTIWNEAIYDDCVSKLEEYFLFRRTNKDFYWPEEAKNDEDPTIWRKASTSDVEMVSDDDMFDDPMCITFKKLLKANNEVEELKEANRRLKRINKKLYIFGLEQVWQQRNRDYAL